MGINFDDNLDGIIMCAVGLAMCFEGRRFVGPVIKLAAFVLTVAILMFIFYEFVPQDDLPDWAEALAFCLALLAGFFSGHETRHILQRNIRICGLFIGAWAGYALGQVLEKTMFSSWDSSAASWAISLNCAAIVGLCGYFRFNHTVIMSTAFIGAYLLAMGVADLMGQGEVSDQELADAVKDGSMADSVKQFLIILIGGTFFGSGYQFRRFSWGDLSSEPIYDEF